MGIVYSSIKLKNAIVNSATIEMEGKVDSGATMLVLPKSVADDLNLPFHRKITVKYANEETAERDVVYGVELEICGRKAIFEAIVEPKKKYPLIGAIVMETLDLIIEPRDLKIYPNPRSPLMPMAEIE